jgi:hypothetical protein
MTESIERMSDLDWWEAGIKIYNETRCRNCGKGDGMTNPRDREGRCLSCNSMSFGTFPRVVVRK